MTLESDANPPAFPRDHRYLGHNGMTLRDWFASQALANKYTFNEEHCDEVAAWAYHIADAMLEVRAASLSRQNEEKANG